MAGNPEFKHRAPAALIEPFKQLVAEAGGFVKFVTAALKARRERGPDWLEVPPAEPAAVERAREAHGNARYKAGHADGLREAREEQSNDQTMLGYSQQAVDRHRAELDQREHELAVLEARKMQSLRHVAQALAALPGGRTALANALFIAREDRGVLEYMAEEVGVSLLNPNETFGPEDARRQFAELVFTEAKDMAGDVLHRDPDLALRAAAEVLDTMARPYPTVRSQAGEVRPAALATVLRALRPWANRLAATPKAQDHAAPRRFVVR